MSEQIKERDYSILYIALTAIILIGVLLAVKSNENDKFAPIKEQVNEELRLMNVRVISNDE